MSYSKIITKVQLFIIDNTTGYRIGVAGPQGTSESQIEEAEGLGLREEFEASVGENFTNQIFDALTETDPRGEPIPIHGIGVDNLPPVMNEPMQIINSVSIARR